MSARKGKKAARRLDARRADYSKTIAGHPPQRGWGGYHRPGSNKK